MNPDDPESWNNKGAVLTQLGRNKEALLSYSRVIELNPGHTRAWQNLGLLYQKDGNKKAAKECFDKAKKG